MPGPRKVRVFRDRRKSPNWYVEWRDLDGHRHCQACGPQKHDAERRARQILAELRHLCGLPDAKGDFPVVQVRGILRCARADVPVEMFVEMQPELLESIRAVIERQKSQ